MLYRRTWDVYLINFLEGGGELQLIQKQHLTANAILLIPNDATFITTHMEEKV